MSKSKLTNNAASVKRDMRANLGKALAAMGVQAVSMIQDNMETGYGKPIRQTGALNADVSFQVNGDVVEVGNTLFYSKYVHDGTSKMGGRAYINDAVLTDAALAKLSATARDKLFNETGNNT